ncbi:MAG: oxidative damage protection protein [Pseudomonadales bacterium]
MSRSVMCRKYQQQLEGLQAPPYPGPKGEEVFNTVSAKAWGEWQSLQTMLINEKRLNAFEASTRAYLGDQMEKFFDNGDYDHADGYVPPAE